MELHTTETSNSKHPIFSLINIDAYHTKISTKIKTNKQRTQVLLQRLLWLNPLYSIRWHTEVHHLFSLPQIQASDKLSSDSNFFLCNMNKILCFSFDSKIFLLPVSQGSWALWIWPPKLLSKCLVSVLIQSPLSRQFLGSPNFLGFILHSSPNLSSIPQSQSFCN